MGSQAGGHQCCGEGEAGWESLGYKSCWKRAPHPSSVPVLVILATNFSLGL